MFGALPVLGMLSNFGFARRSLLGAAFWQYVNQTHNSLFNYANRNASVDSPEQTKRFFCGYFGAVVSSVTVILGLTKFVIEPLEKTNLISPFFRQLAAYPAVALGNVANVLCMRGSEAFEGVAVKVQGRPVGEDSPILGVSRVAGWEALKATCLTRVILPIPVLFIPTLLLHMLSPYMPSLRRVGSGVRLFFLCGASSFSLAFFLPLTIAIFPPESQMSVDRLEKNLQLKATHRGLRGTDLVHFNKGL